MVAYMQRDKGVFSFFGIVAYFIKVFCHKTPSSECGKKHIELAANFAT